jgi:hypothetical protein
MSRGKMGNFAFVLAGNLAEGLNTFEIKVRTFSQKLFDPTSKLPGGRIYKVSREESASEASLPGDEPVLATWHICSQNCRLRLPAPIDVLDTSNSIEGNAGMCFSLFLKKRLQAYEKNRRLLVKHAKKSHAQDGLEGFHSYLHTERRHHDISRPPAVLSMLFLSL